MIGIVLWAIIFVVSLAALIKSSDYFTDAAEKLGIYAGLPPFIVGVTIVSVGTSLPELASSFFALGIASDIITSNVVGSNIANILLVMGVAAIVGAWKKPIQIKFDLSHVDLPILLSSAFLFTFVAWTGQIDLFESSVLLAGYIIYAFYSISKVDNKKVTLEKHAKEKTPFPYKQLVILIVSGIIIFFGAKYTIDSVVVIATLLNVHVDLITITAVALGTSLPELFVSIAAARKGSFELALGNVVGSNIFNTFMVIGLPGLFGAIAVPDLIRNFSLPVMIAASLLCMFMIQDKQITKWEGLTLVLFYVFFIVKVITG